MQEEESEQDALWRASGELIFEFSYYNNYLNNSYEMDCDIQTKYETIFLLFLNSILTDHYLQRALMLVHLLKPK